jgi:serine/threonine protein kinase
MEFKVDQVFAGRYRLISKIGIGGFSEVWKVADQMANDSILALKVYAPDKGLDEFGLKQFRREYAVVLNLNHSNLLTARHFDIHEGHPYLIMPFCEGGSVYGRIIEHGTFSEKELAEFLIQISPALEYLHENEIVHQDIKPDNILLDGKGNYLLMDFGISGKLRSTLRKSTTAAGAMTVAYAPPEKFKGMGIMGAESDIFSLGVMMIEMLTGDVPWNGMGGAYLRSDDDLPDLPKDFSRGLRNLITSCLKLNSNERCSLKQVSTAAKSYLINESWGDEPLKVKSKEASKLSGRKTVKMESFAEASNNESVSSYENKNEESGEGKVKNKNSRGVIIGSSIFILLLIAVLLVIKPWSDVKEPENNELVTSLIREADSLEKIENWRFALEKYKAAFELKDDSILLNHISRLEEVISINEQNEKDENFWQSTLRANSISSFKMYLDSFPEGKYAINANEKIAEISKSLEKKREVDSRGSFIWSKTYVGKDDTGNEDNGYGTSLILANDGNYIASGFRNYSQSNYNKEWFVKKISNSGKEIWEKTYFKGVQVTLSKVIKCKSGYLLLGNYQQSRGGLIKINENGEEVFKYYGENRGEIYKGAVELADGSILVVGAFTDDKKSLILSLSSTGKKQFQVKNQNNNSEKYNDITRNGNRLYVLGDLEDPDGHYFGVVREINSNGEIVTSKQLQMYNSRSTYLYSISTCSNGDVLFSGTAKTSENSSPDFWIGRLNKNLELIWQKALGGSDYDKGSSIIEDANGNLLFVGLLEYDEIYEKVHFYKMTGKGEVVWSKSLIESGEWFSELPKISPGKSGILLGAILGERTLTREKAFFGEFRY